MIPLLLWRCPVCGADESLVHTRRFLRPDQLRCDRCNARWLVQRRPGGDFYLIPQGDSFQKAARSLADIYREMKQKVVLAPIQDESILLQPGEELYLVSKPAVLHAEATDEIFFPGQAAPPSLEKRQTAGRAVGPGRLVLTSARWIWQGEVGAGQQHFVSFPLQKVQSVYAMMDYGLSFLIGLRLYCVDLAQESCLKWITYYALVARRVLADSGHIISTSHD